MRSTLPLHSANSFQPMVRCLYFRPISSAPARPRIGSLNASAWTWSLTRICEKQSCGAAEGTPPGSMPSAPPPPRGDRMHHCDGVAGSETRFQWASRAYAALDRVIAVDGQDSVVVTYGGTATYLIAAWIGLPIEAAGYVKFNVSPGSITHLRQDDFFHDRQVVALNDLSHLT